MCVHVHYEREINMLMTWSSLVCVCCWAREFIFGLENSDDNILLLFLISWFFCCFYFWSNGLLHVFPDTLYFIECSVRMPMAGGNKVYSSKMDKNKLSNDVCVMLACLPCADWNDPLFRYTTYFQRLPSFYLFLMFFYFIFFRVFDKMKFRLFSRLSISKCVCEVIDHPIL